jgi:hypothetical protein
MFEFTAGCEELFEVQFLPGIYRPTILNLDKPAVRLAITNPDSSYWLRASSEVTTDESRPNPQWSTTGPEIPGASTETLPGSGAKL